MDKIQNVSTSLTEAAGRDKTRYPSWISTPRAPFATEVSNLQAFITNRLSWLDSNINTLLPTQQCTYPTTDIVLTEIRHTDPEFIELKNIGVVDVDMGLMQIGGGIRYSFTSLTITTHTFAVLVQNSNSFNTKYQKSYTKQVEFQRGLGDQDTISLLDIYGTPIWTVNYASAAPWPDTTSVAYMDRTIVPANTPNPSVLTLNDPTKWVVSHLDGGSPDADDANSAPGATSSPETTGSTSMSLSTTTTGTTSASASDASVIMFSAFTILLASLVSMS